MTFSFKSLFHTVSPWAFLSYQDFWYTACRICYFSFMFPITKTSTVEILLSLLSDGHLYNDIALDANNDRLENVTEFKYLGVTINQYLTWHDHIDQLQSKVAKRLGVLKRIRHLLPVYARKIYGTTMVIPILECASIVWDDKKTKF